MGLTVAAGVGAVGGGAGCGGDDTSAAGGAVCFDYSGFDGSTPEVSFTNDVLPIFQQSCSLSASCHGRSDNATAAPGADRPIMGRAQMLPSDAQVAAIFEQNVNANAKHAEMKIILPGDPSKSFMTYKMDGSLDCPEVTCSSVGCGTPMPQATEFVPIAADKRDTIRRWIAQGAQNDWPSASTSSSSSSTTGSTTATTGAGGGAGGAGGGG